MAKARKKSAPKKPAKGKSAKGAKKTLTQRIKEKVLNLRGSRGPKKGGKLTLAAGVHESVAAAKKQAKAMTKAAEKAAAKLAKEREKEAARLAKMKAAEAKSIAKASASAARKAEQAGPPVCREVACELVATSGGYCRLHYIKNWKKVKRKEMILKERKLNHYIEELVSKYPDKYIEAIREDLASEKNFAKVIADLEIDENMDDFEMETETAEGIIDNIKRDFEDEGETF